VVFPIALSPAARYSAIGAISKVVHLIFSTKQNKRRLTDKEFTFSVSDGEVRGANKGSVE